MLKKINLLSIYMFIFGLLSTNYFLMIGGKSFVFFFEIGTICIMLTFHSKIKIKSIDKVYVLMIVLSLFTLISNLLYTNYTDQWKWQALAFFIIGVVAFFFYVIVYENKIEYIYAFWKGFKISIFIQVIYGYLQYIASFLGDIDLNELLFRKITPHEGSLSHFYYGELVPSGFSWHPGTYAPLLVIGYWIFNDKIIIKLLIIGIAVLTKSSTCVLGILTCVIIDFVYANQLTKKKILRCFLIVLISIFIIISTKIGNELVTEVEKLFNRITTSATVSASYDMSSYYHKRYYTGVFKIAENANVIQLFFGCGDGCSGYPFVKIFGQYKDNAPWAIESQIMSDLISKGLLGFGTLYYWIANIAIKGRKIDRRYMACIIALMVESITYNIAFVWVILFEIILSICVKKKTNIWRV